MSKTERTQLGTLGIRVLADITGVKPGKIARQLLREEGFKVTQIQGRIITYRAVTPAEKRTALKVRTEELIKQNHPRKVA